MFGSLSFGLGLRPKPSGQTPQQWLAAYMAGQSDGADYEFARADRLYQDPTGSTPVTGTNQEVGLVLDQRLWSDKTLDAHLAVQSELVTNGTFDVDTAGWTASSGTFTASGGVATKTASVTSYATMPITTVVGRLYRATATILSGSSNSSILKVRKSDNTTVSSNVLDIVGVENGSISAPRTGTLFFVATATTTYLAIQGNGGHTLSVDNISVKAVGGYPATQATQSFRPKLQAAGALYDGNDDRLLTNYVAGSGPGFMVLRTLVPASVSGVQIVFGAAGAGNLYIGFGSNRWRMGVGGNDYTGATDINGQDVVLGLSWDGAGNARLFQFGQLMTTATYTGSHPAAIPLAIGAVNNNGTVSNFYAGSATRALAGRQFIDLDTFNKIAVAA